MRIFGIILIVLGLLGFVLGGASFMTEEQVADLGPLEVEQQEQQTIPYMPIASGVAVVTGLGLVFASTRKKST